jgi:hypothetical protein
MKQWKSLTLQLKKIFDDLPTATEKEEMVNSINSLKTVLDELGKSLFSLPTADEASRAKESLTKLENIIDSNPLLRTYTARNTKSTSRKIKNGARPESSSIILNIAPILDRLIAMPEDNLRHELNDSNGITNNMLRAMLTHLGRKVSSKDTRKEMVEQLIVTVVNRRTYQGLRGEKENEAPPPRGDL